MKAPTLSPTPQSIQALVELETGTALPQAVRTQLE